MNEAGETTTLHRELLHPGPPEGATRDGRRLDHAEGTSKPLRSKPPEPQPRGAKVRGDRPVDQSEAADRFIERECISGLHDFAALDDWIPAAHALSLSRSCIERCHTIATV